MEEKQNIENQTQDFTYRKYAWDKFKKNKPALWSLRILLSIITIAILSPFIANEQPLYVNWESKTFFPAFNTLTNKSKTDSVWIESEKRMEYFQYDRMDWRSVDASTIIYAPIAYGPDYTDKYNRDYVGPWHEQRYKNSEGEIKQLPFYLKHWMGTDKIGRDVAAGIVHGAKISMMIGIVSMCIAGLIGIILGTFAGFFGDTQLVLSRGKKLGLLVFGFLGFFWAFFSRGQTIKDSFESGNVLIGLGQLVISLALFLGLSFLGIQVGRLFGKSKYLAAEKPVKIDSIISRLIEILNSLPTLILIITVAAVLNERSLFALMLIIGLTSWTGIARFMRAELLRIKNMEYIQTAKALGYSNKRIMFFHALPNGIAPVFVSIAFGVASAILVESGLSFLGIGVPDEVTTWGKLLSAGRQEFEASWLVIFPGLAIFITITVYNLIGEGLRDAIDPKL